MGPNLKDYDSKLQSVHLSLVPDSDKHQ